MFQSLLELVGSMELLGPAVSTSDTHLDAVLGHMDSMMRPNGARRGEVLGLAGPPCSGKTTLCLRAVALHAVASLLRERRSATDLSPCRVPSLEQGTRKTFTTGAGTEAGSGEPSSSSPVTSIVSGQKAPSPAARGAGMKRRRDAANHVASQLRTETDDNRISPPPLKQAAAHIVYITASSDAPRDLAMRLGRFVLASLIANCVDDDLFPPHPHRHHLVAGALPPQPASGGRPSAAAPPLSKLMMDVSPSGRPTPAVNVTLTTSDADDNDAQSDSGVGGDDHHHTTRLAALLSLAQAALRRIAVIGPVDDADVVSVLHEVLRAAAAGGDTEPTGVADHANAPDVTAAVGAAGIITAAATSGHSISVQQGREGGDQGLVPSEAPAAMSVRGRTPTCLLRNDVDLVVVDGAATAVYSTWHASSRRSADDNQPAAPSVDLIDAVDVVERLGLTNPSRAPAVGETSPPATATAGDPEAPPPRRARHHRCPPPPPPPASGGIMLLRHMTRLRDACHRMAAQMPSRPAVIVTLPAGRGVRAGRWNGAANQRHRAAMPSASSPAMTEGLPHCCSNFARRTVHVELPDRSYIEGLMPNDPIVSSPSVTGWLHWITTPILP